MINTNHIIKETWAMFAEACTSLRSEHFISQPDKVSHDIGDY